MRDSAESYSEARKNGQLEKVATGIRGFDEITGGGLPRGRATLVTGASGSGKTLFGLEFLVRGAQEFDEPGVLVAFEESAEEIAENAISLGFDVQSLERSGRLSIDAVRLDVVEAVSTGAFDLAGLFIRLAAAIEAVGAKRVVLDTIEVLFGALGNEQIVRSELSRLCRWLKQRRLTTVVTGEPGGQGQLTRHGTEEYVSDCVISLDQSVQDGTSTRRLRVVKYRGSGHGTNEYPFMITSRGFQVLPITSLGPAYDAFGERVSTGIPALDTVLAGGVFRGSTVMITGDAGTGKTTLGAYMVEAACARGEHALLVSFEESPKQLIRNMRSIGLDLGRWVDRGLLTVRAERPTAFGLEAHLGALQYAVEQSSPAVVVLDAVSDLHYVGSPIEVKFTIAREIDLLKAGGSTVVMTVLTHNGLGAPDIGRLSSLTDTWLLLGNVETDGERNRLLSVVKSRGTAHSNQVREFVLSDQGAQLVDVYVGPHGVVTGSARVAAMAEARRVAERHEVDLERRRAALAQQAAEVEAKIEAMRAELDAARRAVEVMTLVPPVGGAAREAPEAARRGSPDDGGTRGMGGHLA